MFLLFIILIILILLFGGSNDEGSGSNSSNEDLNRARTDIRDLNDIIKDKEISTLKENTILHDHGVDDFSLGDSYSFYYLSNDEDVYYRIDDIDIGSLMTSSEAKEISRNSSVKRNNVIIYKNAEFGLVPLGINMDMKGIYVSKLIRSDIVVIKSNDGKVYEYV